MNVPIREITRRLNAVLGPRLVAALAGATNYKASREWAMADGAEPPPEAVKRIAFAYQLWLKVAEVEGDHVARAWFIGGNPWLGEDTPVTALREDRFVQADVAAQALINDTFTRRFEPDQVDAPTITPATDMVDAMAHAVQATENVVKGIEDEFGLLTSAQVGQLLAPTSSAASVRSLANDMRARGELLYVSRLNEFLYPGFQFDRSAGRVHPLVKSLIQLADTSDRDPQSVVMWLCSPTTYFGGSRPVDHFETEPDRVLDVARRAWNIEW